MNRQHKAGQKRRGMLRKNSTRFAAAVAAVLLTFGVAQPAQALSEDERYEALWYARALKFDELQAAGHDGSGVKIAVIDNVVNLEAAELQGANIRTISLCKSYATGETWEAESQAPEFSLEMYGDQVTVSNHGTMVTAMIVGNGVAADGGPGTRGIAPRAEILFYGLGVQATQREINSTDGCVPLFPEVNEIVGPMNDDLAYAVAKAVLDGADVVSISSFGDFAIDDSWNYALALAAREGVPIVAGTPNPDDLATDMGVPFSLNGVVAIGGVDSAGAPLGRVDDTRVIPQEVFGSSKLALAAPGDTLLSPLNGGAWEPGITQGTSFATPLVAGALALGMQAYPQATGYQVLQAMTHTTGGTFAETPTWYDRQLGYGYVSPKGMLAVDPAQLPDENPLFVKDVSDPRCGGAATMTECAWATYPTTEDFERIWAEWDETPVEEAPDQASSEENPGGFLWKTLAIVGSALLVGALAITNIVLIMVSRKKKRHANQQS